MMWLMRTLAGRVFGALLCAALALSPAVLISTTASAADMAPHAQVPPGPPCDMPCDHCSHDKMSIGCALACGGLVSVLPIVDVVRVQITGTHRIVFAGRSLLAGHEPEPDTPPPRFFHV